MSRSPRPPLGRSVLYSLTGVAVPAAVAVLAIPPLLAALGAERFGVLALAWSLLAYLGLLNLGVGRALVHVAARRGGADELPGMVWTAALLLVALGAVGGAALYAAAPWLAGSLLDLPEPVRSEARTAFRLLAPAVPLTVGAAAFTAVLEARQRFGVLNALAVPLSAAALLGPLAVLQVVPGLVPVAAVLLGVRIAGSSAYLLLALRELPELRSRFHLRRGHLAPLLRFGGWVTVSHVASPLMVHADRFVVAVFRSAAAVAYYATPQEAVLRLGALPGAVAAVLFPAFAAAAGRRRLGRLVSGGVTAVLLAIFPIALVLHAFPGEILGAWVGAEYAAAGGTALRWLALGLLANALARIPAALLVGRGRPDLTGRLHLVELPLYLVVLWVLVGRFGIAGAAAAWSLRAVGDAAALYWLAAPLFATGRAVAARVGGTFAAAALSMAAVAAVPGAAPRAGAVAVVLAAFAVVGWTRVLGEEGRYAVRSSLSGGATARRRRSGGASG